MIAWHFLRKLHEVCHFQTIEGSRVGRASSSELKRWFESKCVEINHETYAWDEEMPPLIYSMVLFPKNERKRCTLFHLNLKEYQSPKCSGCGCEIDPDYCHCGDKIELHDFNTGHSPVPAGCTCFYVRQPQE